MHLDEFDYPLPAERIAQTPAEPRDQARLLSTRQLTDHHFWELPSLLRPSDLVVINTTRVRPARLEGTRVDTGGRVELLVLDREELGGWEALVRPARRIRRGVEIDVGAPDAIPVRLFVAGDPIDGRIQVEGDVAGAMDRFGAVPLPPYIHDGPADPELYQTIYAEREGSAAAPTAGLHFTDRTFHDLERAGIEVARIDLHVGLGTFRPIATERVADHRMHTERYEISDQEARRITEARRSGRRVVAIGTTVVRALESAWTGDALRPGTASTDVFIAPGFEFGVVDALVTNFHIPRSSLLVMIAAFMGPSWRKAYETALERGYRFLSFGDAMLAERA